jgi:hypothetical protein
MVSCSHCGIHVPLSEAVQSNGGSFFCSIEHQRQHTGWVHTASISIY